jgi:hypothetical protein
MNIYSLYVDNNGDRIFISTDFGCRVLISSGMNWTIDHPVYFSTHIANNKTTYLTLTQN